MNFFQFLVSFLAIGISSAAYSGDIIQYWIDQTSIFINGTIGGLQTPATAWSFAILSASMYNAAEQTQHQSLNYQQVAVSHAAHNSLGWIFHGYRLSPYIDQALKAVQTNILTSGGSINLADAISSGQGAARAVITARSDDGLNNFVDYTFGPTKPGIYQLTVAGYGLPPDGPQVPYMRLFANDKPASAYLAPAPPKVTDSSYEDQLAYIKAIGVVNSATRTPDQTDIALFWREGAPTKWNRFANVLVGTSLNTNVMAAAQLRAQLNFAIFNAAVASWVSKFKYNTWRPETAIHRTDIWLPSGHDLSDSDWKALITPTPIEQEYTSGHGTVGGAAAAVLKAYNGGDKVDLYVSSLVTQTPQHMSTRHYTNLTAAGLEIAYSRVYGGIHFNFTATTSVAIGTQVGLDTLASFHSF